MYPTRPSHHGPTSSMPYGLNRGGGLDDSPTAHRSTRSRMVSQSALRGQQAAFGLSHRGVGRSRARLYVSHVVGHLRRARYHDLLFGFVFFASLLAFLSALGGVGYDDDIAAFTAPLVAPLAKGGLAFHPNGRARLEDDERASRGFDPAELLRMLKPIPVPNPKEDEPLFADVLPGSKKRKAKKAPPKRKASPAAIAVLPDEDSATFRDETGDGALARAILETRRRRKEGISDDVPYDFGNEAKDEDETEHEEVHPDHIVSDGTIAGHRGIFDPSADDASHVHPDGASHDRIKADDGTITDEKTVRHRSHPGEVRADHGLQGHDIDRPYADAHGLNDVTPVYEYDEEQSDGTEEDEEEGAPSPEGLETVDETETEGVDDEEEDPPAAEDDDDDNIVGDDYAFPDPIPEEEFKRASRADVPVVGEEAAAESDSDAEDAFVDDDDEARNKVEVKRWVVGSKPKFDVERGWVDDGEEGDQAAEDLPAPEEDEDDRQAREEVESMGEQMVLPAEPDLVDDSDPPARPESRPDGMLKLRRRTR